ARQAVLRDDGDDGEGAGQEGREEGAGGHARGSDERPTTSARCPTWCRPCQAYICTSRSSVVGPFCGWTSSRVKASASSAASSACQRRWIASSRSSERSIGPSAASGSSAHAFSSYTLMVGRDSVSAQRQRTY